MYETSLFKTAIMIKSVMNHLSWLFNMVLNNEHPRSLELLMMVLHLAVFWGIIIESGRWIVSRLIRDKPWFQNAMTRDYNNEAKKIADRMGSPLSEAEYVQLRTFDWGMILLILFQHIVSSCLCIPSILNVMDESTASSLACLAILSEMGWEIEHLISMFFQRCFLSHGKIMVPDVYLVLFPMHHSLTTFLGIPAILKYRTNKLFHQLTFDLQIGAGTCLAIGEYTKLLDISQPRQLYQFIILTGIGFVLSIWTRVIYFLYLMFQIMKLLKTDGNYLFMSVGLCSIVFFSTFSYLVVVEPFFKRLKKFIRLVWEYETTPVSSPTRRSSLDNLQIAASELSSFTTSINDGYHVGFSALEDDNTTKKNKASRRQSTPVILHKMIRRLSGSCLPPKSKSSNCLTKNFFEQDQLLNKKHV